MVGFIRIVDLSVDVNAINYQLSNSSSYRSWRRTTGKKYRCLGSSG